MAGEISNIVSDAIADPPRNRDLKEQIQIQEQKSKKIPPNPEINNDNSKLNDQRSSLENGSDSDDHNSNHEKEQDKKPKSKRKSRNSSSRSGGTIINNFVSNSTGVNVTLATQTIMNFNSSSASTNRKDREKSEEICRKMPQHIQNLLECDSKITNQDKLTIKKYIGSNWKRVARNLLIRSEADQCFIDNKGKKIGEIMFQVLTVWEQRYPEQAVLGKLIKILWSSKEYDCAEKLADINDPGNKAK